MKNFLLPITIIFLGVALRLMPHPANVAPIAAIALFGGVYLDKKYALVLPLIAMLISDFFLGFHNVMPFVYGSFLLSGLLGMSLKNHKSVVTVLSASLASSLLFFIITNFGVWMMGSMYAKTMSGLLDCYVAAIPFFRNTVFGDMLYTGIFFGGFEVVKRLVFKERVLPQHAN